MKKLILSLIIAVVGNTTVIAQHSDTLYPVADVYLVTFGGGQGKNTLMKFDISSIPDNAVVSDVHLEVYVGLVGAAWDGDIKFMNVNSQGWLESDQETTLWNLLRTDTVIQLLGFGASAGWTSSVDIKPIFNRDYNQGNIFCSIQLKDPDDPTIAPMSGTPSKDSNDSLICGNMFNDFITFPPHEYVDQELIPRLIVNYIIAPEISAQPLNSTTCEGNMTSFNVSATGDDLSYQWQLNGSDIQGATTTSYAINLVTPAHAGNYQCIVSNTVGDDTSNIAVLTVNPLPISYNISNGGSYCEGGAGIDICLSGSEPGISYFLYCDGIYAGVNLMGTGALLCFGLQAIQGIYTIMASNLATGCLNTMAGTAVVIVNSIPVPDAAASPDSICSGGCSTLSASGGVSYQWSSGTNIVCPANSSEYYVTVTAANGCTAVDTVAVFVDLCTGISENSNAINIQFTPNPFSTSAEIISDRYFNDAVLEVYDMLGNKVKRIQNIYDRTIYMDRTGFTEGMYYYSISERNITLISGKFIVY